MEYCACEAVKLPNGQRQVVTQRQFTVNLPCVNRQEGLRLLQIRYALDCYIVPVENLQMHHQGHGVLSDILFMKLELERSSEVSKDKPCIKYSLMFPLVLISCLYSGLLKIDLRLSIRLKLTSVDVAIQAERF
jgi:hypothetical protein